VNHGFFASLSLWTKIKLGLAGIGLLVTVPFYFFMTHRATSNAVMFENSLDTAGDLVIDGASKGTIGPKQHLAIELDSGHHTLAFNGAKGTLDSGSLDIPKKGAFGYRALYNLGGKSGIAVVTKYYGKDSHFENKVEVVPEGTRLVELPETSVMRDVDEAFPSSVTATKNTTSLSVTRMCHVVPRAKKVACPGY
jgi:hypothetical protein